MQIPIYPKYIIFIYYIAFLQYPQHSTLKARNSFIYVTRLSLYHKIKSNISLAKAIISPPKKDRKPLLFCVGSCPCTPKPICTTPQPRIITPTALIAANTNVERLLIAANGSVPTAKAFAVQNSMEKISVANSL